MIPLGFECLEEVLVPRIWVGNIEGFSLRAQ